MKRVIAELVIFQTVNASLFELIVDSLENMHLASIRVLGQNMHEVLLFVVFTLHNFVVCSLRQQCEDQIEFALI